MGEFFHGTRRKMGVMTLVLASVFMAGWIRSLVGQDYFELPFQIGSIVGVGSERQSLVLFTDGDSVDLADLYGPATSDSTVQVPSDLNSQPDDSSNPPTFSAWEDVNVGGHLAPISITISCAFGPIPLLEIPYWSVVVPLTLLSAYLLLGRTKTTTKLKAE